MFAPALDLYPEFRWGRVEEIFGEDPILTGEMDNIESVTFSSWVWIFLKNLARIVPASCWNHPSALQLSEGQEAYLCKPSLD